MLETNTSRLLFAIFAMVAIVAFSLVFLVKTTDPYDSTKQVPVIQAVYDDVVIRYHDDQYTGNNRE